MVSKCIVACRSRFAQFFAALFQRLEAMSGPEDSAAAQQEVHVDEEVETGSSSQGSTTAASSSADRLESAPELAVGKSSLLDQIQALRRSQQALKDQKKQVAKDMKNAMKKKKRLQGRASQLSDKDLIEVLRMRKARKGDEGQDPREQA